MTTDNEELFATKEEIFAAHAEFGRLDKESVKKAMGPNWPHAWDRAHPDIFEHKQR